MGRGALGLCGWRGFPCAGWRLGFAPVGELLSFDRQKKVAKEKATPASASPLRSSGATCGARSSRGPRKLAAAQTARGPDPAGPVLLGAYTRGWSPEVLNPTPLLFAPSSAPKRGSEERMSERSEFAFFPRFGSSTGCPEAQASGSQTVGSPFFGLLFFGEQRKVRRRRAQPGSRPTQ